MATSILNNNNNDNNDKNNKNHFKHQYYINLDNFPNEWTKILFLIKTFFLQ